MKVPTKPKETASQRALRCLHGAGHAGLTADEVGGNVWPDRKFQRGRGASANGGGYYAAQMLLGRLKKAGLVEYAPSEGSSRWRLSRKGRDEVGKLPDVQMPKAPRRGGVIVNSSDPCTCGCAPEEHGRDPEYPGSTSCNACDDCIAYEADPEAA